FEEAKEKVKDYKKSLDEEYKKKNQDLEAKYQEKINKLSLDSIVQKLKKEAIEVIDNLKNKIKALENQVSDWKNQFQAKCLELDKTKAAFENYQELYETAKNQKKSKKKK
ncbi:hypothetical protein CFT12S02847_09135, partial [Campylobacter fetus subsp. testudinum]|uniref:hypothetical protein n=1 Tax=Campylobacter fetus TaxID=196 RepID=UPI0008292EF2